MSSILATRVGHIIKLKDNIKSLLNLGIIDYLTLYDAYDDVMDEEEILNTITELVNEGNVELTLKINDKQIKTTLYIYDEEDSDWSNELERGSLYIIFNEDDLYEKKEKPLFKQLKKINISPEKLIWIEASP